MKDAEKPMENSYIEEPLSKLWNLIKSTKLVSLQIILEKICNRIISRNLIKAKYSFDVQQFAIISKNLLPLKRFTFL